MTNPFAWTGATGELWQSWMPSTTPDMSALFGGLQVSDLLRQMTEGPKLADAGAAEHRMARLMERWLKFQTASRAYEGVVASAWLTANQSFAGKLQTQRTPLKADEALKLWLETANTTLLETQRTPAFLDAQRELLRCGIEFLLTQRDVVESVVEPAGLPTRTELDEVHRTIQNLKRRLRVVERKVDG